MRSLFLTSRWGSHREWKSYCMFFQDLRVQCCCLGSWCFACIVSRLVRAQWGDIFESGCHCFHLGHIAGNILKCSRIGDFVKEVHLRSFLQMLKHFSDIWQQLERKRENTKLSLGCYVIHAISYPWNKFLSNGKQSILKCRPEESWRIWSVLYHRRG